MFFPKWKMRAGQNIIEAAFGDICVWDGFVKGWVEIEKNKIYLQIHAAGKEAYEALMERLVVLEYISEILVYTKRRVNVVTRWPVVRNK